MLSHELGHVLNIIGHPSDLTATLRSGGRDGDPMFTDADRDMFFGANPDFVGTRQCSGTVIRSSRTPDGLIGHCLCE